MTPSTDPQGWGRVDGLLLRQPVPFEAWHLLFVPALLRGSGNHGSLLPLRNLDPCLTCCRSTPCGAATCDLRSGSGLTVRTDPIPGVLDRGGGSLSPGWIGGYLSGFSVISIHPCGRCRSGEETEPDQPKSFRATGSATCLLGLSTGVTLPKKRTHPNCWSGMHLSGVSGNACFGANQNPSPYQPNSIQGKGSDHGCCHSGVPSSTQGKKTGGRSLFGRSVIRFHAAAT
jgi:hypothetical protein